MSGGLEGSFLEDIVANIDDDTPRLVYADWLTENGQDERAEFIRVQVQRSRLPAWDAAQVRLRLREQELLKQHGEAWLAEMPRIEGVKWEGFRRGIVAEVAFSSFETMRIKAPEVRAVAPLEAASVSWPRHGQSKTLRPVAELRELVLRGRPYDQELTWFAQSPQLATLRSLAVLGLTVEDLTELVASPHLSSLRVLSLMSHGIGNAGVRALTGAATLTALQRLNLTGTRSHEHYYEDPIITAAGLEALAGWAGLASVRSLTLTGGDVGGAGLGALLRSRHAKSLTSLNLHAGRLDGAALAEFNDVRRGLRLEALDLGENVLGEAGAEAIASARCLSELKALRLDRCELPLAGARVLAKKAKFLKQLRQLEVGHNHFGPVGLAGLLEREPPALHTLRLRDNDLFDKGAALLADSAASNGLLELDLSQNSLTATGSQALGASENFRDLLVLRLTDNAIGTAAEATLKASPLGQRLAVLDTALKGGSSYFLDVEEAYSACWDYWYEEEEDEEDDPA
jgi:uncharacterized protein (TIGR02996 family)